MSNPGPAITTSIHPQLLGSNQALRVIAMAKGVSVAALGDTSFKVIDTSAWVPVSVVIANANNAGANVDVSSVHLGVYTAVGGAGGSGAAVLTTAALTSQTTQAYVTVSAATTPNTAETAQTLYVNQTSAVATATVDVYVYGYDLSGPQTN